MFVFCFRHDVFSAHAALMPATLPSVQSWDVTEGDFVLTAHTAVYVGDDTLSETAALFQTDIYDCIGRTLQSAAVQEGNICLLFMEEDMPKDGYRMTVTKN